MKRNVIIGICLIAGCFSYRLRAEDRILEEICAWKITKQHTLVCDWSRKVFIEDVMFTQWNQVVVPDDMQKLFISSAEITYANEEKRSLTMMFHKRRNISGLDSFGISGEAVAVFPGLKNGCILSFTIHMEWSQISNKMFSVLSNTPKDHLTVEITYPRQHLEGQLADSSTFLESAGPVPPFEFINTTRSFNRVAVYQWKHLPVFDPEPFGLSPLESGADVFLRLLSPLIKKRSSETPLTAVTFFKERQTILDHYSVPLNLDVLRMGRKVTKGLSSDVEKLQAIYRFVTMEIRDITDLNLINQAKGNILRDYYGHRYQKISLLRSLLRAAKIPCQPGFFQERSLGVLNEESIFRADLQPLLHINCDGKQYNLAPYLNLDRLDCLPLSMRGAGIVFLNQNQELTFDTLPDCEEVDTIREHIVIRMALQGAWQVRSETSLNGCIKNQIINELQDMSEEEFGRYLKRRFRSRLNDFQLLSHRINREKGLITCSFSFTPDVLSASLGKVLTLEDLQVFPFSSPFDMNQERTQPIRTPSNHVYSTTWLFQEKEFLDIDLFPRLPEMNNVFGSFSMKLDKKDQFAMVSLNRKLNTVFIKQDLRKHAAQMREIYRDIKDCRIFLCR